MKTVAIFGSTGSIGKNAIKVISRNRNKFRIVGLAAGKNASLFASQIHRLRPKMASIMDKSKFPQLKRKISAGTRLFAGEEGLEALSGLKADIVVMAIGGSAALLPTLKVLEKTKRLALANKECLVMAGDIIMRKARRRKVEVIPVDSEHSAIFQCLKNEKEEKLERIYLTGSGGPLRDLAEEDFEFVQPRFALRHPRWKMGKKISIDSATLMNKGFEVIEASYLFNLAPDKIKVLIHPEALIHSMVQFVDGAILAQIGKTDMRIPIQYALTYPQRFPLPLSRLDFSKIKKFTFYLPDLNKFPCLRLALEVVRKKGLSGCVLNACDEECVWAYLNGKIKITDIARITLRVLTKLKNKPNPKLEEILKTNQWAREQVRSRI